MGGLPLAFFDSSGLWSKGSVNRASGYFRAARRPDLGVALGTVAGVLGVLVVVALGVAALALVTFGVPRVLVFVAAAAFPLGVDVWPAFGAVGRHVFE